MPFYGGFDLGGTPIDTARQQIQNRFPGANGFTTYPGDLNSLGFSFPGQNLFAGQPPSTLNGLLSAPNVFDKIGSVSPESVTAALAGQGMQAPGASPGMGGGGGGMGTSSLSNPGASSLAGVGSSFATGAYGSPMGAGMTAAGQAALAAGTLGFAGHGTPATNTGALFGTALGSTFGVPAGGLLGAGITGFFTGAGSGLPGFNAVSQANQNQTAIDAHNAELAAMGFDLVNGQVPNTTSNAPLTQNANINPSLNMDLMSMPGSTGLTSLTQNGVVGGIMGSPSNSFVGNAPQSTARGDLTSDPTTTDAATATATATGGVTAGNISGISGQDTAAPDGPGAGDGGSGDSVICTACFEAGYMDADVYDADTRFGRMLPAEIIRGYHSFAVPIAGFLRRHRWALKLVVPFVNAWAQEMSYQMGVRPKGSRLGRVMMALGIPLCRFLGTRVAAGYVTA